MKRQTPPLSPAPRVAFKVPGSEALPASALWASPIPAPPHSWEAAIHGAGLADMHTSPRAKPAPAEATPILQPAFPPGPLAAAPGITPYSTSDAISPVTLPRTHLLPALFRALAPSGGPESLHQSPGNCNHHLLFLFYQKVLNDYLLIFTENKTPQENYHRHKETFNSCMCLSS